MGAQAIPVELSSFIFFSFKAGSHKIQASWSLALPEDGLELHVFLFLCGLMQYQDGAQGFVHAQEVPPTKVHLTAFLRCPRPCHPRVPHLCPSIYTGCTGVPGPAHTADLIITQQATPRILWGTVLAQELL